MNNVPNSNSAGADKLTHASELQRMRVYKPLSGLKLFWPASLVNDGHINSAHELDDRTINMSSGDSIKEAGDNQSDMSLTAGSIVSSDALLSSTLTNSVESATQSAPENAQSNGSASSCLEAQASLQKQGHDDAKSASKKKGKCCINQADRALPETNLPSSPDGNCLKLLKQAHDQEVDLYSLQLDYHYLKKSVKKTEDDVFKLQYDKLPKIDSDIHSRDSKIDSRISDMESRVFALELKLHKVDSLESKINDK